MKQHAVPLSVVPAAQDTLTCQWLDSVAVIVYQLYAIMIADNTLQDRHGLPQVRFAYFKNIELLHRYLSSTLSTMLHRKEQGHVKEIQNREKRKNYTENTFHFVSVKTRLFSDGAGVCLNNELSSFNIFMFR